MYIAIFLFIGIILYLIFSKNNKEKFWDGYYPIPLMNPNLIKDYGQTAIIASTDEPEILIDCNASPVNY